MSMEATKGQLIQLLGDADNKVLALSGKWGTGKTHMWREVRTASADDSVKNALYVSLFGLSDLTQIKLKIVQSALSNNKKSPAWNSIGNTVKGARKVLVSLHGGFSAIDELALLAVPAVLKNRVIVLDDIERKHQNLNIDEVLGFIDEFTQLHGARFVLVLNSDQLKDKEIWGTLREKVVDQEIRLDTSPSEAFEIAIGLVPSRFAESIREAIRTCRVTNIRVIRKVIKAVNQILDGYADLPPAVLARVVPSTVLLAAINYRGVENGPDFDYVLSSGVGHLSLPDNTDSDLDEQTRKARAGWDLMLSELGVMSSDEYELVVVEFLQSGLFNGEAVAQVVARYLAQDDALSARNELSRFLDRVVWDHRLTDEELLAQANELLPRVRFLDASFVTHLAAEVSKIAGGQAVSDRLIDEWLQHIPPEYSPDPDDEFFFHREMHPRIKDLLSSSVNQAYQNTSIFDALAYITEHSGWGARQEMVLKAASVDDFESTIRMLEISDLRRFMRKMLDLSVNRERYIAHFGSAMDRFVDACKNIVAHDPSSRLSKLIRGLFESQKIGAKLVGDPPPETV